MHKINSGAPAFPVNDQGFAHRAGTAAIEGITDSAERDRLYIAATADAVSSMSLRDYFAAKAMAALIARGDQTHEQRYIAQDAYDFADHMLEARGVQ